MCCCKMSLVDISSKPEGQVTLRCHLRVRGNLGASSVQFYWKEIYYVSEILHLFFHLHVKLTLQTTQRDCQSFTEHGGRVGGV